MRASSLASDSECLSTLLYDVYVSAQDTEVITHNGQLCCWFRAINHVSSGLKWGGDRKGTRRSKPAVHMVQSLTESAPTSATHPKSVGLPSNVFLHLLPFCNCFEDDGCLGLFSSWKVSVSFLLSPYFGLKRAQNMPICD